MAEEWGAMQPWQLTIPRILEYAEKWHPNQEVVCRSVEGPTVISSYADLGRRARLCAAALTTLGCGRRSVVATLAWNTTRHMEAWYGIAGIGAVCHTLNPRLAPKDLAFIINHAQDEVLLADTSFVDLLAQLAPLCPGLRHIVLLTDAQHMVQPPSLAPLLCYEALLDAQAGAPPFEWVEVGEEEAVGLCYTSGTTGNPKGVIYTHRSNWLHALVVASPDAMALGAASTVMAIVPLFHANGWGIAFAAPMVGARLVLPGPHLDGPSVHHLLSAHSVTHTAGVPTVWLALLQHLQAQRAPLPPSLRVAVIGGAAPPRSMVAALEALGAEVRHMWGMTELSPIGSLAGAKGAGGGEAASTEERLDLKVKQGRPHILCDWRIVDGEGRPLPHDGVAMGHLQVRGPHTVQRYHRQPGPPAAGPGGWFDTGDVATIDAEGFMKITDRSKDVIKSGGEWISSIDLENTAMGHPGVAEAAVIGVPDDRWGERPLLVVVPKPPAQAGPELQAALLEHLAARVARYAVPERVAFVAEIPHNATGKISKLALRAQFVGARSRL